MGHVSESAVSLRFIGDTLDPDELTRLMGVEPSGSQRTGGTFRTPKGTELIARTGSWRLSVERRSPADVAGQVAELLAPLTTDLEVWQDLAKRYRAEIFCGLFLIDGNEGLTLPAATLRQLADRGLAIDFDIYGSSHP